MINKDEFESLLLEVKRELLKFKIPVSNDIDPCINYVTTFSTLGMCERNSNPLYKYNLTFSELIFYFPINTIKDIIAHELIHSCPNCFDHRNTFKMYANTVNRLGGYNVYRCLSREDTLPYLPKHIQEKYKQEPKYFVKCNKCGDVVYRFKKSNLIQHPEQYRCCICGGKFESYHK